MGEGEGEPYFCHLSLSRVGKAAETSPMTCQSNPKSQELESSAL